MTRTELQGRYEAALTQAEYWKSLAESMLNHDRSTAASITEMLHYVDTLAESRRAAAAPPKRKRERPRKHPIAV